MVERGVERRALGAVRGGEHAIAHERAARVEAHPRELREAIELGEGIGERHQRAFHIRGDAERLS